MDRRPKLFGVVFDLNQTPLSSPRETVADDGDEDVVVVEPPTLSLPRRNEAPVAAIAGLGPGQEGQRESVRDADGELMLCINCRSATRVRGPPSLEGVKQWRCFRCLLKDRGGDLGGSRSGTSGGGRGGGVALLDINASPPREVEAEAVYSGPGDDVAWDRNHGDKVQVGSYSSFSGRPVGLLSTFSNMSWPEKGFHLPKPPNIPADIAKSGSDNVVDQRRPSETNSNMIDFGSAYEGRVRATNSPVTDYYPKSPNELYLEGLRDYITKRKGVLGDGWSVEFEFSYKRLKTFAIFHAPDGSRFESMSDVAHHLGLPTNPHPPESENVENGSVLMQNGMPLNQRRKESSLFTRASNSRPWISSPLKSLSSGVESLNSPQDGFPIQFEDFYLISAGVIDSRPSYHSTNQIWPVGYRSIWHDKVTGSLFLLHITDGGDTGPNFMVQRYPCMMQTMPFSSTVLSRSKCEDNEGKDDSARFGTIDEEGISIQMILTESSPPHLDDNISSRNIGDNEYNSQKGNLPSSDSFSPRSGNLTSDILRQSNSIGEFAVEGRSPSSVWEKVCETFLHACNESYNQKGVLQLGCDHGEMYVKELENVDSLSKFSHLAGPMGTRHLIRSSDEFGSTCELVAKWLEEDRFGLDAEFVQEIIEQLPGVSGCSGYTFLTKRKHHSPLQTVGSGCLQAKMMCVTNLEVESDGYFRMLKRPREHLKHSELRGPFPLGKPICSRLPADLISDALQVWEFLWRFCGVLGLQQPLSLQELEDELINPWLDGLNPLEALGTEIHDSGDISSGSSREASQARVSCPSCCRCTGIVLTKSHGSLLKVLVGELLSKVAVYVDPNFDAGESKSRRGRKKDAEHSTVAKKMKLDMLPVNELTWPEIARRYILAVLSMEGNLDSAEIACRESGKVFHCLRGDGGTLCGSLTGVAALEADALLLAEATKRIFGSLKTRNEAVSTDENESNAVATSRTVDVNNDEVPEWAQVLEPVRKLPTNVGARIRRCVYEALKRNPPEWAREKLEHSISKEVYKGNASGPTKRAVIEVLAHVSREKLQQKPEKKEKVKSVYTLSDLIMKQCRIVLRRAISADEDRVFCNLLARTLLNPNDNDDEGLLGHPAMVSRPLDFRTIDLRLAAGAYGGSHEAFLDDVREVWHNVRTACREQSDLIELAETLSQHFEELYEKEVLTFVQKTAGVASSCESEKERDDVLAHANDSSLPKAPWDEGICKVCGMDKDDDNVLLCDNCDSEYHTYCLNPPLIRIPEGNWYCPSCVTGKSLSQSADYGTQIVNQCGKRRYQRKHIDEILEGLAQLANKMELKEYWEFTIEERIFLIKFLCDEAMNSSIIRDHIDQCATMSVDLQQRLRSLNSERKILKLKEESLAANVASAKGNVHCGGGELGLNGLASVLANEAQLADDNKNSLFSDGSVQMEDGPHPKDHNDFSDQSCCYSRSIEKPFDISNSQNIKTTSAISQNIDNLGSDDLHQKLGDCSSSVSGQSTSQLMPGYDLSSTVSKQMAVHASSCPGPENYNQTNVSSLQECNAELSKLQQEISGLQESINTAESELLKVSFRKEFLGRDSYGRLYWVFARHGACPWIVANGSLKAEQEFGLHNLFPKATSWMHYDTDAEIEELVNWLDDGDMREKELKESILQWQSNKSPHTDYTKKDILKGEPSSSIISSGQRDANPSFLVTKAVRALEKKFGPGLEIWDNHIHKNLEHDGEMTRQGRMCRCECLELLWPSRHHCFSCHMTFSTSEEFVQHSEKCTTVSTGPKNSQMVAGSLKHKKMVKNQGVGICSGSSNISRMFLNEKHDTRSNSFEHPQEPECPFNFEEIMAKFKVENSLKELIKDIGLIGTNGVVPFVPNSSPCLNDPALTLVPLRANEVCLGDQTSVPESQQKLSDNVANIVPGINDKFSGHALSTENDKGEVSEVECMKPRILSERGQLSSVKNRSSLSISRRSIIRESSLRPKVGKASEILRCLKINLLDMDAALPEVALRASRSHLDRRCAWRTFVKSANTLYEMVLAQIILEDSIKADYLRNDWWYWSSPSAAANISTLSALAFRIYTLDSAIFYEKPLIDDTTGTSMPDGKSDKEVFQSAVPTNDLKPVDQPMQKILDSDSGESSRPRTRMSKRRKETGG